MASPVAFLKFNGGRRKKYDVNPGSKAAVQGIREGDTISSINGKDTEKITNSEAHTLLKEAGPTLCLSLSQGSGMSKKMFKSSVNVDVRSSGANSKTSGSETSTTHSNPVSSTVKSLPSAVDWQDKKETDCFLSKEDAEASEFSVPQRPPRKRKKRFSSRNLDCMRTTETSSDMDSDEDSYRPTVKVCIEQPAITGIFRSVPAIVRPASDCDDDRCLLLAGLETPLDPLVLDRFNEESIGSNQDVPYIDGEDYNADSFNSSQAAEFNLRSSTAEGIISILDDMEKEILQAGYPEKLSRNADNEDGLAEDPNQQPPMIGGLTVEEFIRFLALLERIREQHLSNKDASFPTLTEEVSVSVDLPERDVDAKSGSPYDNLDEAEREDDVASCPSDSDSEGEEDLDAKLCWSIPAPVAALSLLFPRRYLHMIPEEGSSSEASNSTRHSRALSILSELTDISLNRTPRSSLLLEPEFEPFFLLEESSPESEIPPVDLLLSPAEQPDHEAVEEILPVVLEELNLTESSSSNQQLEEVDESFIPLSVFSIEEMVDSCSDSTEVHEHTRPVQELPRVAEEITAEHTVNQTLLNDEEMEKEDSVSYSPLDDNVSSLAGDDDNLEDSSVRLKLEENTGGDEVEQTVCVTSESPSTEGNLQADVRDIENDKRLEEDIFACDPDNSTDDNCHDNDEQTAFFRASSVVTLTDIPLQILSIKDTLEGAEEPNDTTDNKVAWQAHVSPRETETEPGSPMQDSVDGSNSRGIATSGESTVPSDDDEKHNFCRSLLAAATVRLLTAAVEKDQTETCDTELPDQAEDESHRKKELEGNAADSLLVEKPVDALRDSPGNAHPPDDTSSISILEKAREQLFNLQSKEMQKSRNKLSTGMASEVLHELRHYWKRKTEREEVVLGEFSCTKTSNKEPTVEFAVSSRDDHSKEILNVSVPRLEDLASRMLLSLPNGANLLQVINVGHEEERVSHHPESEVRTLVTAPESHKGLERCVNETGFVSGINQRSGAGSNDLPAGQNSRHIWSAENHGLVDPSYGGGTLFCQGVGLSENAQLCENICTTIEENQGPSSEVSLVAPELSYFNSDGEPRSTGVAKKHHRDIAPANWFANSRRRCEGGHFGAESGPVNFYPAKPVPQSAFLRISSEETGYSTDSDFYTERTPPRPPPPCEEEFEYLEEPWCYSELDMPYVTDYPGMSKGTPPRPPARNQNTPARWIRKSGLWRRKTPSPCPQEPYRLYSESLDSSTGVPSLPMSHASSTHRGSISEASLCSGQSSLDDERLKATMLSDWLLHAKKTLNRSASNSKCNSPASTIKRSSFSSVSSRSGTLRESESPSGARSIHEMDAEAEAYRDAMLYEYRNKLAAREDRKMHKSLRLSQPARDVPAAKNQEPVLIRDFMDRLQQRGACCEGSGNPSQRFDIQARIPKHIEDDLELLLAPADEDVKASVEECITSFCDGNDPPGTKDSSLLSEIEAALCMGLCKTPNGSSSVLTSAYTASSPKPGVWSPGQSESTKTEVPAERDTEIKKEAEQDTKEGGAPPPVWTPSAIRSPSAERKEFRPVRLETGSLRKQPSQEADKRAAPTPPAELSYAWQTQDGVASTSSAITTPASEHSFLTTSTSTFFHGFGDERRPSNVSTNSTALSTPAATPTSHLPKAPNPTVTLLQKAREGHLTKGAPGLDSRPEEPRKFYRSPFETLYTVKREYESEDEEKRKIVELSPKKFSGIGPTTNEGIPTALRAGIDEENHHQWYRRMYDSLHRAGKPEDYVTVRYKTRGRGGYVSEPEPCDYDSDAGRYSTLDRRRNRLRELDSNGTLSRHVPETYRVQPGRIENYEPGRSSVVQHEAKQWWDEIMGMLDGVQRQINTAERPFVAHGLKESGYESDSQLLFRRRADPAAGIASDPRAYYRDIQRGGEVPLYGLRKPLPEKPRDPILLPNQSKNNPKPTATRHWSTRLSDTLKMLASPRRASVGKRTHETTKEKKNSLKRSASCASPKTSTSKMKTWRRVKGLRLYKKAQSEAEPMENAPQPLKDLNPVITEPDDREKADEDDTDDGGFASHCRAKQERASRIFLENRRIVTQSKFLQQDPIKVAVVHKLPHGPKYSVENVGQSADNSTPQCGSSIQYEESETELVRKTNRVSQLRSLYSSLERIAQLEKKTVSMSDLSRLSRQGLADYQVWKKIRDHEKAEEEIRQISTWILNEQRQGNFYVLPSDVGRFRWSGDSGLRIKEASVEALRGKFQKVNETWPRNPKCLTAPCAQRERVNLLRSRLFESRDKMDASPYEITVSSAADLSRGDLYVRSSSDSSKDQNPHSLTDARSRALSVSGVTESAVQRSQSLLLSSQRESSSTSGERLTSRTLNRRPRSTRAAIQYVQQLSAKLSRDTTSRSSSRNSSVSDQSRDYLLVLTPATKPNVRDVESVVKEWAANRSPSTSMITSSSSLPAVGDTDSRSSSSSRQTVIHCDVLEKVKYFETRIRLAKADRMRSSRSVSDLPSQRTGSAAPHPPKRALSLNLRKPHTSTSAALTKQNTLLEKSKSCAQITQDIQNRNVPLTSGSCAHLKTESVVPLKRKTEVNCSTGKLSAEPQRPTTLATQRNLTRKSVSFTQVKQTLLSSARLAQSQARSGGSKPFSLKIAPVTKTTLSKSASSIEAATSNAQTNDVARNPIPPSPRSCEPYNPTLHEPRYRYTPSFQQRTSIYATYPRRRVSQITPPRPPLPKSTTTIVEVGQDYYAGGGYNQNAQGAGHKFSESEVTIRYKSPIRSLQNAAGQQEIDEEDLRQQQADHMRRVYEQERRRKLLQELEDLESRRHMDNFTPSQKSPIPLNRYDTVLEEPARLQPQRERTPEPKIVARALFNFVAMSARELSFQKGDIIFVRRQIDKNWYEGEHNAMIGIFPVNYVEIIPYDGVRMAPKKPTDVQGKVKHNFTAQTPMELSLVKGELVLITRHIDDNWLEGRIGNRKGIFPASYVDIVQTGTLEKQMNKPVAQPVSHSLITNGSLRNYPSPPSYTQQQSYQQQQQQQHQQIRQQQQQHQQIQQQQQQQQQQKYSSMPRMGYNRPAEQPVNRQQSYPANYEMDTMQSSLHVDTQTGPVLYRALYPYAPQNDDELELQEGDTVCVLEKCDDGWYVGTSQRTGHFGTFPGNYVERI